VQALQGVQSKRQPFEVLQPLVHAAHTRPAPTSQDDGRNFLWINHVSGSRCFAAVPPQNWNIRAIL
jgi:hypothetical protein